MFPDKLLNRPISVSMVAIAVAVLGVIAISRLPVSLIPDVDIPYVTVKISAPDMSAVEIQDAIVNPLRQRMVSLDHLSDLHSEARDGSAAITLKFDPQARIDYMNIEVNELVDRAMSYFPDVERPKVIKASASDIPAFYVNVTVDDGNGFPDASRFVENVLAKRLEQLDEVAMVDATGIVREQICIRPDSEALSMLGLSPGDLADIVSSANIRLGSLSIRDGEYRFNVKFQSFVSDVADISDIWFSAGGRAFQVKDVAEVSLEPAQKEGCAYSDGREAIVLAIIKQSDARMSELKAAVNEQISWMEWEFPALHFTVTRDQTELLEYSIDNLVKNIIIAILFACLVIFLFMKDFRSPFLVALTIPFSLLLSMLFFYVLGISINIISLSGLLLGVGMMVDNSIILTDNITASWQRSASLREAVSRGTREVLAPMLSSVLTTCAVFIPLVFISGTAGKLFYDQAISITIVLLSAYVVTVIFVPVYYNLLYRRKSGFEPNRILERIGAGSAVRWYERTMMFFLRHRRITGAVALVSVAACIACVAFMPRQKMPDLTYTDALLKVEWNEHVALDENRSRLARMESALQGTVIQCTSMSGVQQYVLAHDEFLSGSEATLYIKCESAELLSEAKEAMGSYLESNYPGAIFSFANSGNIFETVFAENEPELLARVRSTGEARLNASDLKMLTAKLHSSGTLHDSSDIPVRKDVLYVADQEKMAFYGVGLSSLLTAMKSALGGMRVFEIVRGSRSIPVVVIDDSQSNLADLLETTYVSSDAGVSIPVCLLVRQSFEENLRSIVSDGGGEYFPLEVSSGTLNKKAFMMDLRKAVREAGEYDVDFSGSWFSNIRMLKEMLLVLLVAVLLLYLILASQFESLIQPLIILSEIVIDIAVSLSILWLLGETINILSLIGLVVVSGIVINDSILKIDTINHLRISGLTVRDAILEAGHRRLKAIVMTSVTTIISVLPFLSRNGMGSELQYPMSLVIIVGMSIGTLVSLFYVPALYAKIYER